MQPHTRLHRNCWIWNFIVVVKQEILVISLTYCLLRWWFTSWRHTGVISVYLLTVPANLVYVKLWSLATKIRFWWKQRLHDSAWSPLWDFSNDTSSAACELTTFKYCHSICFRKKTSTEGLPVGEKNLTICLLISIQYTNLTDRQTDTARRYRPRCA